MNITDLDVSLSANFDGHERVTFFDDPETGLKAIIALHNTNLGPGFGGCRFYPYTDHQAALEDVLRLSRGMTYKSALVGLPLGGGKSVIIGNPKTDKTPAMMRAFGKAIESLQGRYIVAEDVGTTDDDMVEIASTTIHVSGLPEDKNFPHELRGNPSPITAQGVISGVKSALIHHFGHSNPQGLRFAVQGLGAVGYAAAEILLQEGAQLIVADLDQVRIDKLKSLYPQQVQHVAASDILMVEADVLMPCAMGGILNDTTIPQIKAKIIAGAANNQLALARHDKLLKEAGILYAPDYVINAGGIVAVAYQYFERTHSNPSKFDLTQSGMRSHVEKIKDTTSTILREAAQYDEPTGLTADRLARAIFQK